MNSKYDIMFNDQKNKVSKESFSMNIITSNARFQRAGMRLEKKSFTVKLFFEGKCTAQNHCITIGR